MTWLSFALALLRLVNLILGRLHDQRLIDEGKRQQINSALLEIGRRSALIKEVAERIESMTDEEVKAELDKSGRLRD